MNMLRLKSMLLLETAAGKWWDRMTSHEREAYVKAHPRSKYARNSEPGKNVSHEDVLAKHGWTKNGENDEGSNYSHPCHGTMLLNYDEDGDGIDSWQHTDDEGFDVHAEGHSAKSMHDHLSGLKNA